MGTSQVTPMGDQFHEHLSRVGPDRRRERLARRSGFPQTVCVRLLNNSFTDLEQIPRSLLARRVLPVSAAEGRRPTLEVPELSKAGVMHKAEFLASLDEVMQQPPETLRGSEPLDGLPGWDSVALMGFIALVDEKFGVRVTGKQILQCRTVDDLVALTGDRVTL